MKKVAIFVALTALLLGPAAAPLQAVPMYYTFEGTVSGVHGFVQGGEPAIGTSVSYTFLVDSDLGGFWTQAGVQHPWIDTADADYFYAEYVSGSATQRAPTSTPMDWLYSYYVVSYSSGSSRIEASPSPAGTDDYNFVRMTFSGQYPNDWVVGTFATGIDFNMAVGEVDSNLTLTAISGVPEPSTMLLLGTGLLGLVGLNRRHREK